MLLVPRQLKKTGMTGDVPYYGGRFTPAQAYAASHPPPKPPPAVTVTVTAEQGAQLQALQHLLDTGVITPAEHAEFQARVVR